MCWLHEHSLHDSSVRVLRSTASTCCHVTSSYPQLPKCARARLAIDSAHRKSGSVLNCVCYSLRRRQVDEEGVWISAVHAHLVVDRCHSVPVQTSKTSTGVTVFLYKTAEHRPVSQCSCTNQQNIGRCHSVPVQSSKTSAVVTVFLYKAAKHRPMSQYSCTKQ